jgi:hypothetical protein
MGYYAEGYIEDSYFVSLGNPACLPYLESGYIAEGYFTNNNLQLGYYADGYIADGYAAASQGYIEQGYISDGYYEAGDTCGITFSTVALAEVSARILDSSSQVYWEAEATVTANPSLVTRFSTQATCGLQTRVTVCQKVYIDAIAITHFKATKMKDDSLLDWMNSISECCFRQEQRIIALEKAAKDHLIAKDIEPLFSGREVHYDV